MLIRDLTDGDQLSQALLVSGRELKHKRDGGEFLRIELSDRSGTVPAMIWEPTSDMLANIKPGVVLHIDATYSVHARWGPQFAINRLRPADPQEYSLSQLTAGPPKAVAEMEAELDQLIQSVTTKHLHLLLETLLGKDTATGAAYREAPAAKRNHQAYRHGLLEHSLTVAQAVAAVAGIFPGINRDIAVTGALLHDIGKLQTYTREDPLAIDFTDNGRLQGEIPLGYYLLRSTIQRLEQFPEGHAQAILHIILSHHGSLEFGSPVVPCTREATLVHMIDNLGGRLGTFDRIEQTLAQGQSWSSYDRALGGSAFFG